MKKQMIKRADGSYSQRGLWDNIRANRGSGKKPTSEMLKQESKIKSNMQQGGMMPQTSAGQSVLKEAMKMSRMQDGAKVSPITKMREVGITKKRSFGEKVAGNFRQAKKALGMNPYRTTDADQGRNLVFAQEAVNKAEMQAVSNQAAAENKKASRNIAQRVGDEFGTYLNLGADRNVLTDIVNLGTTGAAKLGMNQAANSLMNVKKGINTLGKSTVGKTVDILNPLTIGANLVGGATGTAGDISLGNLKDAAKRAGITGALALTKGVAGKVASGLTSPAQRLVGKKVQHQLAHAGQHELLSPLMAHKNGGSIKDMYSMKKGGKAIKKTNKK